MAVIKIRHHRHQSQATPPSPRHFAPVLAPHAQRRLSAHTFRLARRRCLSPPHQTHALDHPTSSRVW